MNGALQAILYLVILVALAIPLGKYISKVMNGERVLLTRILGPCERGLYKLLRVDSQEDMGWKKYALCAVFFNLFGLIVLFLILMLQGILPWNPQGFSGLSWHLALNTAISFVTNTNWQTYSGEVTLSNFSQAIGLTVQNFVSAACGIAVLLAIIRGFIRRQAKGIGSFWVDLTRSVLYIMLPISLVASIALIGLGVPQSLGGNTYVDLVEPIAADGDGSVLTGADIDVEHNTVTLDGQVVEDAQIITRQVLPLYPGLGALNVMGLASPTSAILSALIYNALIIVALIPLALKGVKYREVPAGKLLSHNLLVYGLGGIIIPFIAIKAIDLAVAPLLGVL